MPTPSELKARYTLLSDERLRAIVLHPADYTQEALQVAEECLRERGLSTEGPEADWTDISLEQEQMDVEDVSIGMKGLFFFFPGIGLLVVIVWLIQSARNTYDPRIAQSVPAIVYGFVTWTLLSWLLWAASQGAFY
jgi:hypothetical protein